MKDKKTIIWIIICVVLVAVALFVGTKIPNNKKINPAGNFGQFNTQLGQRSGNQTRNMGSGMTIGEILSKDMQSITIKTRDGGSKIIFYNNKTSIQKTVDGNTDNLIVGKEINVFGSQNTDGSVNAQTISVRSASPVSLVVQN